MCVYIYIPVYIYIDYLCMCVYTVYMYIQYMYVCTVCSWIDTVWCAITNTKVTQVLHQVSWVTLWTLVIEVIFLFFFLILIFFFF